MKVKLKTLFTRDFIILYLILAAGSLARIMTLLTNSFAFTYDVGRDMIAISQIVSFQKISLIGATTGLPGIFYGPWWYWMLSPFFVIFAGDPRGVEFAMFLAGFATMVALYFVGKKVSGNFLGLVMTALAAVSSLLIFRSAQIWNPNIAPLFTVLSVLCLINILFYKKESLVNFFFLGLLLALCIDVEIVYGTLLFIGTVISLGVIKRFKFSTKSVGIFILGAVIIFSPRIAFELHHNFLMTNALIVFLKSGSSGSQNIISLFSNRLAVFLDEFSQSLAGNNQTLGLVIGAVSVLLLGSLYKSAEEQIKSVIKFSTIIILTFFIGALLFKHDLYPHYFAGLAIFFILEAGVALDLVYKKFKNILLPTIILLSILFINFNPISFVSNSTKPQFTGDAAVYRNQLQVIDYVYAQAKGKSFKYVVYTPPVYDYSYRYLFSWYGPKKYGYKPSVQSKLAFFILEPDHEMPQRLTDWLKIREHDGTIIKNEKFKSGIIVQTRINK